MVLEYMKKGDCICGKKAMMIPTTTTTPTYNDVLVRVHIYTYISYFLFYNGGK